MNAAVQAARAHRESHEVEILTELRDLLRLPNVATDERAIRANARRLRSLLSARGVDARLLEVEGSPPVVFGTRDAPGATATLLFYAHYDGQPADTARWSSDPWDPVLRTGALGPGTREIPWDSLEAPVDPEWRVYARSASDDKSPIVALLAALDALDAEGIAPSVNLRVLLEGEEEAGSPHLRDFLERHGHRLDADLWVLADGPVHQSGRAQLFFGVRGIVGLDLEVYGASRGLHSGHYGNWAPNPATELVHLLASMRDTEGRITIDGFHDDVRPVGPAEREAVDRLPAQDSTLRRELALARTEAEPERLELRILRPALNVGGLEVGGVGEEARTVISSSARAFLDFRLVPDQDPDRVKEAVERHVEGRGYHVVGVEPDEALLREHPRVARMTWGMGYPPAHTPVDAPESQAVTEVVRRALGEEPVLAPLLGGSLPTSIFQEVLGVPMIGVPMVNADNNQHAPDENLRIGNLWRGIEVYAALLAGLGPALEAARP